MFVLTLNLIGALLGPVTVMGASTKPACGHDVYETSGELAPHLLKSGQTIQARVCRIDSDVYGLGLHQGDSVSIRLESMLPNKLKPTLTGPDSTELDVKQIRTATGVELRFTVAKSGVHRIRIRSHQSRTVVYTLEAKWGSSEQQDVVSRQVSTVKSTPAFVFE